MREHTNLQCAPPKKNKNKPRPHRWILFEDLKLFIMHKELVKVGELMRKKRSRCGLYIDHSLTEVRYLRGLPLSILD